MRMNSSKRIAPPAATIAAATSSEAEGTGELGDAAEAGRTPGSTPNTTVATPVIASAAMSEPGTLTGVTSPSGTGFIHISRITVM